MEPHVFTLSLAAAALHHGPGAGFLWFIVVPLLWTLLIVGIIALIARAGRRRFAGEPWGHHGDPAAWHRAKAARSAEAILAERFARGEVDETEYRARLEVLRAE